jgi:tetratricopeptide (TPR) repeat protein
MSDLYLMQGRLEESVREMQQAAIFAPYDDYYNMRLSILYLLTGAHIDSVTALIQAIKLSPSNSIYHSLLGDIYLYVMQDESMASEHYTEAGLLDDYDREHVRRLRMLTGIEPNGRKKPSN